MHISKTMTTLAAAAVVAAPAIGVTAAPAAQAAGSPVLKSSRMDVDGDLKRDTTTLTRTGSIRRGYTYTIQVRTARGTKATTSFRVEDGGDDPNDVWYGLTGMDGVRGAEIVVNSSPVGDSEPLSVYTWRRGKLVAQPRPGGYTRRDGTYWTLTNMPWRISGYTFFTDRRGRHVTAHDLATVRSGKVSGTHTTYTWSKSRNTWVKTSTRKSGLISDAAAQKKYAGIFGVTFH